LEIDAKLTGRALVDEDLRNPSIALAAAGPRRKDATCRSQSEITGPKGGTRELRRDIGRDLDRYEGNDEHVTVRKSGGRTG
jgi:hypothetical protein